MKKYYLIVDNDAEFDNHNGMLSFYDENEGKGVGIANEYVEITEDELRNLTNGLISHKIFKTCEKGTKKEDDREGEI